MNQLFTTGRKACLITLYILLSIKSISQSQKENIVIVNRSWEIHNKSLKMSAIKSLKVADSANSIIVKHSNDSIETFATTDIWGYKIVKADNEKIYRKYKGSFLEVYQSDTITIYGKSTSHIKSNPIARVYSTQYFFSKTPDSDIFSLDKENVRRQFSDNPCLVKKMEQNIKWYQDYFSYDKKNKSYKLIEFYKECKSDSQEQN